MAPLQRLTGLRRLAVGAGESEDFEGVQALCQLTGVRHLDLFVFPIEFHSGFEERAQQLTQMTRLTALNFCQEGGIDGIHQDLYDVS